MGCCFSSNRLIDANRRLTDSPLEEERRRRLQIRNAILTRVNGDVRSKKLYSPSANIQNLIRSKERNRNRPNPKMDVSGEDVNANKVRVKVKHEPDAVTLLHTRNPSVKQTSDVVSDPTEVVKLLENKSNFKYYSKSSRSKMAKLSTSNKDRPQLENQTKILQVMTCTSSEESDVDVAVDVEVDFNANKMRRRDIDEEQKGQVEVETDILLQSKTQVSTPVQTRETRTSTTMTMADNENMSKDSSRSKTLDNDHKLEVDVEVTPPDHRSDTNPKPEVPEQSLVETSDKCELRGGSHWEPLEIKVIEGPSHWMTQEKEKFHAIPPWERMQDIGPAPWETSPRSAPVPLPWDMFQRGQGHVKKSRGWKTAPEFTAPLPPHLRRKLQVQGKGQDQGQFRSGKWEHLSHYRRYPFMDWDQEIPDTSPETYRERVIRQRIHSERLAQPKKRVDKAPRRGMVLDRQGHRPITERLFHMEMIKRKF